MGKLIFSMHVSVDGFVAGPKGEMDWIHVDDEIFSWVAELTEEADTALYGRVTFEMMEAYWPTADRQPGASTHDIDHSRWYNRVQKVVLSRSKQSFPGKNIRVLSGDLPAEINACKRERRKNIIIFGSPSAVHSLLDEKLIDEFRLFINPVILAEGIPLFRGIHDRTKLTLMTSKEFSSGVTGVHYAVER